MTNPLMTGLQAIIDFVTGALSGEGASGVIIHDPISGLAFEIDGSFEFIDVPMFTGKWNIIIGAAPVLKWKNPFKLEDKVVPNSSNWKYYDSATDSIKVGTDFTPTKETTYGQLTAMVMLYTFLIVLFLSLGTLGSVGRDFSTKLISKLTNDGTTTDRVKLTLTAVNAIKSLVDDEFDELSSGSTKWIVTAIKALTDTNLDQIISTLPQDSDIASVLTAISNLPDDADITTILSELDLDNSSIVNLLTQLSNTIGLRLSL